MREVLARGSGSGKLFVAGEYAVLRAGEPAVVVAVDHGIEVCVLPSAGNGGSIHAPGFATDAASWQRQSGAVVVRDKAGSFRYLAAALELVEAWRAQRGQAPLDYSLEVRSRLDSDTGSKYGLGSSAAVVAATIAALDTLYGLGLTLLQRFQLGYLATLRIAPAASGGDLAASTFGGWVAYRGPERSRLVVDADLPLDDFLTADVWAGLAVDSLPGPPLTLAVGWTGSPASTSDLVERMRSYRESAAFSRFVEDSRAVVTSLEASLIAGSPVDTLRSIRAARVLLRELGTAAGVTLETPALADLADIADGLGGAGKLSGAGGGDCGIALLPASVDSNQLHSVWRSRGITPLELQVQNGDGDVG